MVREAQKYCGEQNHEWNVLQWPLRLAREEQAKTRFALGVVRERYFSACC